MIAPLRTLLVPLDGSALAEQALAPAIALARATGAALHLTHVFVPYAARMDMPATVEHHIEIERQLEQEARAYLQGVAQRVGGELPGPVHAEPVRTQPLQSPYGETVAVVDALRRHARRLRPNLIVMATHARGGLSRAWFGSVADRLVRRGTVPILFVHPREMVTASAQSFHHVLAPLDGSARAEESLPMALALAALGGTRLTLVQVIIPERVIVPRAPVTRANTAQVARDEASATAYLATTGERCATAGVTIDTATVVDEHPARAILDYASQHDVDLIAISTRGLGGVKRLMLGSVADKVLRGASVPVLMTRPSDTGTS